MSMSDQPLEDFESVARAVLGYLHARFGAAYADYRRRVRRYL